LFANCNMAYVINIDGYIGDEGMELFVGSVFSLKKLKEMLKLVPEDETQLDIFINSGGGLVSEGFAIYDELVSSRFELRTVAQGICASIATIIHQAGAKSKKREIYQNSDYLIHNPAWRPTGPDPMDAEDVAALQMDLEKTQDKIINFYNKITGTSKSVLKEKMAEAITLSAKEAKELGFVDEIIYTTITNVKKYALVAFVNSNPNNMKFNIADEFKKFQNGITAQISELTKKLVKENMVATTNDGKKIYVDGELVEGAKCYEDEAMTTPCADGEYTIGDNIYTISGGAITDIKAISNTENNDEVKKELEAVKAENIKLNAALEEKAKEVEQLKDETTKTVNAINKQFQDFKGLFFTGDKLKEEFQQFDGKDTVEKTTVENSIEKTKKLLQERKAGK